MVEMMTSAEQRQADALFVHEALFASGSEKLSRIKEIIETYPGAKKEDREVRQTAYLALVRNLRDFPDPQLMCWHIAQIAKESNKYVLYRMLDEMRNWPFWPADADITPLLQCIKSDKWLIYQGSIMALSICDTEPAREAVRPFLALEPIRKNEPTLTYLANTLARIGTPADIPVMQGIVERSTNRNIKYCMKYAIGEIGQRYGLNSDGLP